MIKRCLNNISNKDPGQIPFYMWIRRLSDTIDLRIKIDSACIKKQFDVVVEYQKITPLIYTIFENIVKETRISPPELDGINFSQVIVISKSVDTMTVEGVSESIEFILQLLELYISAKSDDDYLYFDLFYLVIYQLLFNTYTICGFYGKLDYYDIRRALYVQRLRT